jgi:hypothetical protein
MSGSPSYSTLMRSFVMSCWSISTVTKSARRWRMDEANRDLGGRIRRPVIHRALYR